MIIKNSMGNRQVISGLPRGRFARFDVWPNHAVNWFSFFSDNTHLGQHLFGTSFDLVGGFHWVYWSQLYPTFTPVGHILDSIFLYQVNGYPGDWQGEGFNYIMRSQLIFKGNTAQYAAFKAAH